MHGGLTNNIISILIVMTLVYVIKSTKIFKVLKQNYSNRNIDKDIYLQNLQDKYYANKRYLDGIKIDIRNITEKIDKLESYFEEQKEILKREKDKLKQQKYVYLYHEAKKSYIQKYVKEELIKACMSNKYVLQNQMLEYIKDSN